MKYFIVLLAVGAVFAQQPFDTWFEDNQQQADKTFQNNQHEVETQSVEDVVNRGPAVIPSTRMFTVDVQPLHALINSSIDKKVGYQPGRFKIYK